VNSRAAAEALLTHKRLEPVEGVSADRVFRVDGREDSSQNRKILVRERYFDARFGREECAKNPPVEIRGSRSAVAELVRENPRLRAVQSRLSARPGEDDRGPTHNPERSRRYGYS
jgi:hypothetical protein